MEPFEEIAPGRGATLDHEAARSSEPQLIEMIATRVLPSAIRGIEIGGGPLTYRRTAPLVVPGDRVTIGCERRWRFRKTEMVGGELVHAAFSLRALVQAGFRRAEVRDGALTSPGSAHPSMAEAVEVQRDGHVLRARSLLLDVLEVEPGCILAHARAGALLAELMHVDAASRHFTAAIRLGMAALSRDQGLPLDPSREVDAALLRALAGRARLNMTRSDGHEAARDDLRRALAWEPSDAIGAARSMASIDASSEPESGRIVAS